MPEARVHRHAGTGAGQHFGDACQVQLGQYHHVRQLPGDTFRAGLLSRVAPRQAHFNTHVPHAQGQVAPVHFGPVFGVPRGAVQKQYVRLVARQFNQALDIEAVIAQPLGQVVAQSDGKQLAQALNRMLPTGYGQTTLIKAAGQRFAGRVFPGGLQHRAGDPAETDFVKLCLHML